MQLFTKKSGTFIWYVTPSWKLSIQKLPLQICNGLAKTNKTTAENGTEFILKTKKSTKVVEKLALSR